MTFVRYNESLYRTGHRMFGLTDPFTASHGLSGINHSYGGFGPWMLHGNQPFTERGGEHLSGLGAMVPDQSIVTYTGTWVPHGMAGATEVIGQVSSALASQGLAVRSVSSSSYRVLLNNTFNVKLTIQVANGEGYSDPSDIASIVDHYAYTVTGSMPLASSISAVQLPSGGPPVPTGQPEVPDTGSGSGAQPSEDWSSWVQDNAVWLALGVAGLIFLPRMLGR
jgi:hypothetical protein